MALASLKMTKNHDLRNGTRIFLKIQELDLMLEIMLGKLLIFVEKTRVSSEAWRRKSIFLKIIQF